MKKCILFLQVLVISLMIFCSSCSKEEETNSDVPVPATVPDIDGNVYHTVVIGKQVWLQENLKVTKFNNGDPITNVTDAAQWSALTSSAWSYYVNSDQYNDAYGKLYNGYAILDPRKICPQGWHVPDDAAWTILENFSAGSGAAGGVLKEAGTTHWLSPNAGAKNAGGFTARPGGYRSGDGSFPFVGIENLGTLGLWWSSTPGSPGYLWIRSLHKDFTFVNRQGGFMKAGLSCRCIMD